MVKRINREGPINHERQQIENLKALVPNTTPEEYRQLSDALVNVILASLDIMRALEIGEPPDFDALYDLVDGLADHLKE